MQIKIEGPKCFLQFPIMVHKSITLYKRTPVHGILFSYPMVLIIEQIVCSQTLQLWFTFTCNYPLVPVTRSGRSSIFAAQQ